MVGRALFGNPWFFDASRQVVAAIPRKRAAWIRKVPLLNALFDTKRAAPQSAVNPITVQERLRVLLEHTKLFEELLGDIKSFAIMKKHYKAYCTGFAGAKELRIRLMDEAKDSADVARIVDNFLQES
jgi:tRNA-dihydrouridine synthase